MRIGQGFDVHRFADGGDGFRLGGVPIPYHRGLLAHSDGDVLLHAVTDALLGGAGLGDIGSHFPDDDPQWQDADSALLLRRAVEQVAGQGWSPVNVDATVIAQAPKLAPYVAAMRQATADALALPAQAVNVKATTSERLGFTGRGEGIAALAVILLEGRPGAA
ncbi:2-C-methyl-D-erythritol 2,4-cyclodiphosphate synthase [Halorhodospira neutriphila]|uniref:2-C-methyl-D-erythritol 2,4-cyclodiphosphate synthase n=1 Tax=Halorhodospira neutriphila TaxID=168379 RepID=A0ABS1E7W6_9GAMM|nr:2-C-methyl-D-erythritol 2,4-cyclodiphosphate synthase [Halorhodospira neutriphila]MBK1727272.1 2-C-methyl-D-erythritol 2,4-cyclodiphosphate synthase [Halorhodospira neutriphila]